MTSVVPQRGEGRGGPDKPAHARTHVRVRTRAATLRGDAHNTTMPPKATVAAKPKKAAGVPTASQSKAKRGGGRTSPNYTPKCKLSMCMMMIRWPCACVFRSAGFSREPGFERIWCSSINTCWLQGLPGLSTTSGPRVECTGIQWRISSMPSSLKTW